MTYKHRNQGDIGPWALIMHFLLHFDFQLLDCNTIGF